MKHMETRKKSKVEQRYFTMNDTAKYLGISRITLHRLVKAGEIKSYKVGGLRLFDLVEVDKWIHSKEEKIKKEGGDTDVLQKRKTRRKLV